MSTLYVGKVTDNNVQNIIAELLVQFSGDAAIDRLIEESRFAKQSLSEIASRTAGNLLKSFVTRKPGGCV